MIKFVREYKMFGKSYTDVVYDSLLIRTYDETDELPKTVKAFLQGKKAKVQYDNTFKRLENIYI